MLRSHLRSRSLVMIRVVPHARAGFQACFIPSHVLCLQCRRVVIAWLVPLLRPKTPANDGPSLFSPGLVEWQRGAVGEYLFAGRSIAGRLRRRGDGKCPDGSQHDCAGCSADPGEGMHQLIAGWRIWSGSTYFAPLSAAK